MLVLELEMGNCRDGTYFIPNTRTLVVFKAYKERHHGYLYINKHVCHKSIRTRDENMEQPSFVCCELKIVAC